MVPAAKSASKTFSLVFRYLKQLLSLSDSMPYRKMLALTFTNKAVNEMKSRIITALNELSHQDEKGLVLEKKLCSARRCPVQKWWPAPAPDVDYPHSKGPDNIDQ